MFTEPTVDHAWLRQMVGEWSFEGGCTGPDGETMKSAGTERVTALGELWIICEGGGEMPGGGMMQYRMSLGQDPLKGRYVGTWFCSVMGGMFTYSGWREGDTLTLETDGPSMEDPTKTVTYRDVIEQLGGDRRRLSSRLRGADGVWTTFMQAEYRRVK